MNNPLFRNVGKELKEMAEAKAKWIRIKYALISVLLIVAGYSFVTRFESVFVSLICFGAAILVFMYGNNVALESVIETYAYGELVERVTSIEEKFEKQNREME